MLEYDKIDVSKAVDVNKTDGWRKFIICHNWYFHEIHFRFQLEVCDGCQDLKNLFLVFE